MSAFAFMSSASRLYDARCNSYDCSCLQFKCQECRLREIETELIINVLVDMIKKQRQRDRHRHKQSFMNHCHQQRHMLRQRAESDDDFSLLF